MNISINNSIQKYIINLPERPERLHHSIEQLRKVNLDDMITIVRAVSPEEAQCCQFDYLGKSGYQNIRNPQNTLLLPNYKALACFISHQKCWKHMVQHDIEEAFIIEDDLEITNPHFFRFDLEQTKEIIEENYDKPMYIIFNGKYLENKNGDSNYYYYLESNQTKNVNDVLSQFGIYPEIKYFPYIDCSVVGCGYYYVNLKMATLLLQKLKHINYQLDVEISNLAKIYTGHIFLNVESSSITQSKKFTSDIQFYQISQYEISYLFNLNSDISRQILDYLPMFYRAD